MKKGAAPQKTSCTEMPGLTPASTKQLRPMGGAIGQSAQGQGQSFRTV